MIIEDILGGGKISGDMLCLYLDGHQLACETSCDFSFTQDMKQISPYMAGRWQQVIPGVRSWQMTVSANFITGFKEADFKTILSALLSGKRFAIAMRTQTDFSPAFMIGGYAYPSGGSMSSTGSDIVGYTTTFTGDGPLQYSSEASTDDLWRIINANPAPADKPYYIKSDV